MKRLLLMFVVGLAWGMVPARAEEPGAFPTPFNTGVDVGKQPSSAQELAKGFELPKGVEVTVWAHEPAVQNPVAMAWDARGRMWVAELFTYADSTKKYDLGLRDRVLILEDRDGDGVAETRKVFTDQVQQLMSVEVGRGGVWLICLPKLLFIPDRNGDDVPDGPAEVVLDGFVTSQQNHHNCANGLRWGPDGWLYGRCGASSPAKIGVPGTPDDQRAAIAGGIWRYHPERKVVETLCHGLTNPWGHDWDADGELFFVNTMTGHLFHMLPGAHYTRSATISPHRYVYETIDNHADHFHWDTGLRPQADIGKGAHERFGGGHAHSGTAIYQAEQWPVEYRGCLLTANLHGKRLNVERLERHGCGYTARHRPDICTTRDPWFRPIEVSVGPDGSIYILDWSDVGECHEHDGVHRESGRIFRLAYGGAKFTSPDLRRASIAELLKSQSSANEWLVRQSRQMLVDRAMFDPQAAAELNAARPELVALAQDAMAPRHVRLRALWCLATLGSLEDDLHAALLADDDEHLRTWAIRLLTETWPIDTPAGDVRSTPDHLAAKNGKLLPRLAQLAANDPSGLVRLALASTLQRLPPLERPAIAAGLLSHAEDAGDHDLPKLVWYGIAPLIKTDPAAVARLVARGKLPATRTWASQALAEDFAGRRAAIDVLLEDSLDQPESVKAEIVLGLNAGLAGTRKTQPPASWAPFAATLASASPAVQAQVRNLNVVFGDGRALDEVKRLALDSKAPLAQRRAAIAALIESRPDDLRSICEKLLKVRFLNTSALAGLTLFDDPAIGKQLAESYGAFHPTERTAVIEALVSRPRFAIALLDQIAAGKIPPADLTAFQARQIRSFGDDGLSARLKEVWGELRDSPAEKQALIEELKAKIQPAALASADLSLGRALYHKACANCHRLYGTGGQIGPDLTGSGRANLDYLLVNIVDPSAVVNKDFRMSVVALFDGRVLNGIILSRDDKRLVLQTVTEKLTLPADEIEDVSSTTLSPMPEGLLQTLSPAEIVALMAYLQTSSQVPLPAETPSGAGK